MLLNVGILWFGIIRADSSTNYTAVYENDLQYGAYLKSSMAQMMSCSDIDGVIAGYFNDLSTVVSDLYKLDITLPLQRGKKVFSYVAETPEYHMKQNHRLPLYQSRHPLTLTLHYHSGDCSTPHAPGALIELNVNHLVHRRSQTYLTIPDGCLLYLVKVDLIRREADPYTWKQLHYSHRNYRPPEFRGLASDQIHNVDRYQFMTLMKDFPAIDLQEYNDTHATFAWTDTSASYVIPQNCHFPLFDHQLHPSNFDQDILQMTVEGRSIAKCHMENIHMPSWSVQAETDTIPQIKVDKCARKSVTINTFPDCQLLVLGISRTISFSSDKVLQRQMRYGMNEDVFQDTFMIVTRNQINSRATWHTYIETLEDFPNLAFERYLFEYAVFRNPSVSWYTVPSGLYLVVHTAQENNRGDIVRMSFRRTSDDCQIQLYLKANGERRELPSKSRAFSVTRRDESVVNVVVDRRKFNAIS